jgi:hypothetical protein
MALKDKIIANTNAQNNNNDPSKNYNRGLRPAQGGNLPPTESLKQRRSKLYSFKKDKISQIFKGTVKNGLSLPAGKLLKDADKSDELNFRPYHRILGNTIEDCWVFKDWIEKAYKNSEITLPKGFL